MTKEMADEGMKAMQQFYSDPSQLDAVLVRLEADAQAHLQEVKPAGAGGFRVLHAFYAARRRSPSISDEARSCLIP